MKVVPSWSDRETVNRSFSERTREDDWARTGFREGWLVCAKQANEEAAKLAEELALLRKLGDIALNPVKYTASLAMNEQGIQTLRNYAAFRKANPIKETLTP